MGDFFEHFVGGLDGFGINFVGALGLDHVDHFLDDIDIGAFEKSLGESAIAVFAWVTGFGGAAAGGFLVEIAAEAPEAAGVGEAGELDAKGLGAAGALGGDLAISGDGDFDRACGNGLEATEDGETIAGRDAALAIDFEGAVAGVGESAVGALDLEEAFAFDGDVILVACLFESALGEDFGGGDHPAPVAHFDARGDDRAAPGFGADGARCLVEKILEFDFAAFEAGGIGVGEIVGDGVEVELLGFHACGAGVKRLDHED